MALTDSLISYWKLDESSGNAADAHGSNTLTNNNTTSFVVGLINNAGDLEAGSSQYFSITDAAQSGLDITGDISVSMWVKVESAPAADGLYGLITKTPGSASGYYFLYGKDGTTPKLQSAFFNGASQTRGVKTSQDLGTGTWHHLVFTWAVATPNLTIYVDGSSVGATEDLTAATAIANSAAPFEVGAFVGANFFDGLIDEVGIWSRVLTSDEVSSLYNGGAGLAYPFTAGGTANHFLLMGV